MITEEVARRGTAAESIEDAARSGAEIQVDRHRPENRLARPATTGTSEGVHLTVLRSNVTVLAGRVIGPVA
jgi:hypothetical protein